MRLPLFWRMVAPSLIVSLLLLTVGLAAAIYVYLWNSQVATELDRRLGATLAANEFVISLRDVRLALDQFVAAPEPQFLQRAQTRASEAITQLEEIQRLNGDADVEPLLYPRRQTDELADRLNSLNEPTKAELQALRDFIRVEVLSEASALAEHCRRAASEVNQQNQHVAGLVGTSLALLGLCGAVAGLLAGYSVARSVSHSIEQLGGSIQAMAEVFDEGSAGEDLRIAELHELHAAISTISSRTAGVMNELEQSRDSAVRADQLSAVGQLAAGIAHELRNPLAAVKLLIDSAAEEDRSLSKEDIRVTQEELARMDRMFGSFLDFARPPRLRRQQIDLGELVSRSVDIVSPRARVQDVRIDCDIQQPLLVEVDPQQIRQVVLNLLLNALDAQPSGGRIVVEAHQDASSCAVRISDDGPGIPPQVIDTLFEPFVSTKETGVGLGLAVCNRIVQKHGGQIKICTMPAGGASFSLSLPMEAEATLESPEGHV